VNDGRHWFYPRETQEPHGLRVVGERRATVGSSTMGVFERVKRLLADIRRFVIRVGLKQIAI
jgi:hypothetical protein